MNIKAKPGEFLAEIEKQQDAISKQENTLKVLKENGMSGYMLDHALGTLYRMKNHLGALIEKQKEFEILNK